MNPLEKQWTWYNNLKVLHKIIPYLQERETAFLEGKGHEHQPGRDIRGLRIHNTQTLQKWIFQNIRTQQRGTIYNIYYSTATYKNGIPYFGEDISQRDKEMIQEWKINHWKEMEKVDFFLDIDSPTHEQIETAKEDACTIAKGLQVCSIPYEIRFTGKGFHIVLKDLFKTCKQYNPYDDKNIWQKYQEFAKWYYDTVTELVDYRLNDSRRVIKCPYTLSHYKEDTYVCSPLTMEELWNFKLENYKYENYELK